MDVLLASALRSPTSSRRKEHHSKVSSRGSQASSGSAGRALSLHGSALSAPIEVFKAQLDSQTWSPASVNALDSNGDRCGPCRRGPAQLCGEGMHAPWNSLRLRSCSALLASDPVLCRCSVLHVAAARGNVEAVAALIQKGANATAANHEGVTALHMVRDVIFSRPQQKGRVVRIAWEELQLVPLLDGCECVMQGGGLRPVPIELTAPSLVMYCRLRPAAASQSCGSCLPQVQVLWIAILRPCTLFL